MNTTGKKYGERTKGALNKLSIQIQNQMKLLRVNYFGNYIKDD